MAQVAHISIVVPPSTYRVACESMNKYDVEKRLHRVDDHRQTGRGDPIVTIPGSLVHYADYGV